MMLRIFLAIWLAIAPAYAGQLSLMGVGKTGAAGPVTIFTPSAGALNADDSNPNTSFRNVLTSSTASLGSVRATITASSTTGLVVSHISVCLSAGTGFADCTTAPVELTTACPGNTSGSGFSISAGQSCTTNFVNHSGSFSIGSAANFIIIVDTGATSGNRFRGTLTNANMWFSNPGVQSWNVTAPVSGDGFVQVTGVDYMVDQVETQ